MKKLQERKIVFGLIMGLLFILSSGLVFAADAGGGGSSPKPVDAGGGGSNSTPVFKLDSPIKQTNIQDLLLAIVDIAIYLGSLVAILMFIWIGFKFVMARGNDSEISDAKKWFGYAVVGAAILVSSKVIVEVVKTTLIDTGIAKQEYFNLPK